MGFTLFLNFVRHLTKNRSHIAILINWLYWIILINLVKLTGIIHAYLKLFKINNIYLDYSFI